MKRFLFFFMTVMVVGNIQAAIEPGKTYRIVLDANANKSLFVQNSSQADKAAVVIWTDTDVPAQQWTVLDAGTIVAGYDWFGYDFNDDVMWLVIAAIRGYQATGKQMYLDDAKRRFDCIRCV